MGRIVRNNTLSRLVDEKIEAGLRFMAIRAREIAYGELTAKDNSQGDNPSKVGEYPAFVTLQLADSLTDGFDESQFQSYMGVRNDGPQYPPNRHAGGTHWVWNQRRGRLGIERVVIDNQAELIQEFDNGAQTVEAF